MTALLLANVRYITTDINPYYYETTEDEEGVKMKVVLCTIPHDTFRKRESGDSPIIPKMAIMSLIHWMSKFGYSGDFYDIDMLLPSEDEIFNYFKSKQPDVVGISAVLSSGYLQVKTISSIIRSACPTAWIVVGGNMTASANVILRKTDVDICVIGDGEIPWVDFLDYVNDNRKNKDTQKLSEIKGLAFLNEQDELEFTGYGEQIPDKEKPFPNYDILSKGFLSHPEMLKNYFREGKKCSWFKNDPRTYEPNRKPKLASVPTAKGCVARCTFCQRFIKGYHPFDLEKMEKHLSELKEKYDVQFISVCDETFGSNKKHAYEAAKILKKFDMLWIAGGVRCTSFTFEDLKFLKECGCVGMKYGVESGSKKILDIMEKRFTMDDVYTALKNAHECGLFAPPSFCIGMPGENDQTIIETGRFLGKIAQMLGIPPKDLGVDIFYALPLPGTPLYEYGQIQGVIGSSVDEEEAFLIHRSDKGAMKDNFINLTGMSTKTVLFWDFLLFYEAMRYFYSSHVENRIQQDRKIEKNRSQRPFAKSLNLTEKMFRFLWKPITCLNEILIRSPLIAKLPRNMVYIPMRNLLYLEYKMHIFLKGILKFFGRKGKEIAENIDFQLKIEKKSKKCKPLPDAQSLRKVNKKLREMLPPPQTLTEKNQQILRLGR